MQTLSVPYLKSSRRHNTGTSERVRNPRLCTTFYVIAPSRNGPSASRILMKLVNLTRQIKNFGVHWGKMEQGSVARHACSYRNEFWYNSVMLEFGPQQ